MNSILAAALLFATTFATPLNHNPKPDTTNVTIHSRQAPPGTGTDSGISISIFSSKNCKGKDEISQELLYSKEIAQQTLSYSLSDNIGSDQVLSFWADMNWSSTGSDPVGTGLNGNTNDACAQFVYNAEADLTRAGCHTLPKAVGCVIIMVSSN